MCFGAEKMTPRTVYTRNDRQRGTIFGSRAEWDGVACHMPLWLCAALIDVPGRALYLPPPPWPPPMWGFLGVGLHMQPKTRRLQQLPMKWNKKTERQRQRSLPQFSNYTQNFMPTKAAHAHRYGLVAHKLHSGGGATHEIVGVGGAKFYATFFGCSRERQQLLQWQQ